MCAWYALLSSGSNSGVCSVRERPVRDARGLRRRRLLWRMSQWSLRRSHWSYISLGMLQVQHKSLLHSPRCDLKDRVSRVHRWPIQFRERPVKRLYRDNRWQVSSPNLDGHRGGIERFTAESDAVNIDHRFHIWRPARAALLGRNESHSRPEHRVMHLDWNVGPGSHIKD